jgi:CHASE2 domain-containing sensor protein
MVNTGLNWVSLLALLDVPLAILIFAMTLTLLVEAVRTRASSILIGLYITQGIIVPILLLLAGGILFFQGWRLDPVLQFAAFLLHIIIVILVVKDFFLIYQPRNSR